MDTLCYLGPERVLVAKRHQRCYCVHATIVKPFEQRPWGGIVLDDGFRFVCRHATKACQLLLPELPKSRERLAVNLDAAIDMGTKSEVGGNGFVRCCCYGLINSVCYRHDKDKRTHDNESLKLFA
eukprot:TRINITY_DN11759_c0_g1_i7.p1 TRINITY_DN11759_c0_g1~~TRINITY_DN11759_c0_g1_i7.p1  ORF type:complete len:125 (-),score=4.23 TRINITY_DN11759_c0_g1_i7:24-398(-)